MDEYYQTAIGILTGNDVDYKGICIAVAKTNPKAFCEAARLKPWQYEAREIYYVAGKIAAIKAIRSATGMGLREAKKAIEDLVEQN